MQENKVDKWERVSFVGPIVKHRIAEAGMCQDEKCEESKGKCTNFKALTIQRNQTHARDIDSSSYVISLLPMSSFFVNYFMHHAFRATLQNINTLGLSCKSLRSMTLYLAKQIENGIDLSQ